VVSWEQPSFSQDFLSPLKLCASAFIVHKAGSLADRRGGNRGSVWIRSGQESNRRRGFLEKFPQFSASEQSSQVAGFP